MFPMCLVGLQMFLSCRHQCAHLCNQNALQCHQCTLKGYQCSCCQCADDGTNVPRVLPMFLMHVAKMPLLLSLYIYSWNQKSNQERITPRSPHGVQLLTTRWSTVVQYDVQHIWPWQRPASSGPRNMLDETPGLVTRPLHFIKKWEFIVSNVNF